MIKTLDSKEKHPVNRGDDEGACRGSPSSPRRAGVRRRRRFLAPPQSSLSHWRGRTSLPSSKSISTSAIPSSMQMQGADLLCLLWISNAARNWSASYCTPSAAGRERQVLIHFSNHRCLGQRLLLIRGVGFPDRFPFQLLTPRATIFATTSSPPTRCAWKPKLVSSYASPPYSSRPLSCIFMLLIFVAYIFHCLLWEGGLVIIGSWLWLM